MTKRKDDDQPDPPGGRAAERLRQFQEARGGPILPGTAPEESSEDRPPAEQPTAPKPRKPKKTLKPKSRR